MGYRCEKCGIAVPAGMKANMEVVETRPRTYKFFDQKRKRERETKGHEIVKEIIICPLCKKEGSHV